MAKEPKLKVPKVEGYRAAAAKRLQTPEYQPDEEEAEVEEDEEESEDGF